MFVGRPASGKSEIVDFLKKCEANERRKRFYLSDLDIIDDFPMLWTWFEEDDILTKQFHQPRLYTDEQGYFKFKYLWNLLIERINLEYQKRLRDQPDYHSKYSTIIEFSRGIEHGGYSVAFQHLSDKVLSRACIVYVKVSYGESQRKNRLRFNANRPYSILEHSLPDEKLERLYRHDDWDEMSAGSKKYIRIRNHNVPYVIFDNEDDVTTDNHNGLARRLEIVLTRLMDRFNEG